MFIHGLLCDGNFQLSGRDDAESKAHSHDDSLDGGDDDDDKRTDGGHDTDTNAFSCRS